MDTTMIFDMITKNFSALGEILLGLVFVVGLGIATILAIEDYLDSRHFFPCILPISLILGGSFLGLGILVILGGIIYLSEMF